MNRYTVWYRERLRYPKSVHQKSFAFATEAAKWLDSRGEDISTVCIQRHEEIAFDELKDDAWREFREGSSMTVYDLIRCCIGFGELTILASDGFVLHEGMFGDCPNVLLQKKVQSWDVTTDYRLVVRV